MCVFMNQIHNIATFVVVQITSMSAPHQRSNGEFRNMLTLTLAEKILKKTTLLLPKMGQICIGHIHKYTERGRK